jgi:hypothetical protein
VLSCIGSSFVKLSDQCHLIELLTMAKMLITQPFTWHSQTVTRIVRSDVAGMASHFTHLRPLFVWAHCAMDTWSDWGYLSPFVIVDGMGIPLGLLFCYLMLWRWHHEPGGTICRDRELLWKKGQKCVCPKWICKFWEGIEPVLLTYFHPGSRSKWSENQVEAPGYTKLVRTWHWKYFLFSWIAKYIHVCFACWLGVAGPHKKELLLTMV